MFVYVCVCIDFISFYFAKSDYQINKFFVGLSFCEKMFVNSGPPIS
jgi:hypothetical protein